MQLPHNERKAMSKSKHGDSNLYMTTRDFSELVIESLKDKGSFKEGEPYHPQDIASGFGEISRTIGLAMSWAIYEESSDSGVVDQCGCGPRNCACGSVNKEKVMKTGNMRKIVNNGEFIGESPIEEDASENEYSNWKMSNKRNGYL